MTTRIKINHDHRVVRLTHQTEDDYLGTLIVPFDGSYCTENVIDPQGYVIHSSEFFRDLLGEGDIAPYLVGMTRSARRRVA